MKKKYGILIIALLAISIFTPAILVRASPELVLYEPAMERAEFAFAFDAENEEAGLPEIMPWNVDMVDAENVENDGEGVYIAVLDTGLLPEWPVLLSQANIATEYGKGFSHPIYLDEDGDVQLGELDDTRGFITEYASGHGTHVTSIITGFNFNDIAWIEGVAPKATIIPVLVLDAWAIYTDDGWVTLSGGTDEMISAGIYYVADLSDELDGPVIINMSLGGPTPSPMIKEAIDYAIEKGVIVVVSAGNDGYDGMGYPGAYDEVISVGAAGYSESFYNGWTGDVQEDFFSTDAFGNNHIAYLEDFSARPNKYLGQKSWHLDVVTPGSWVVGPYRPAFSSGDPGFYYVGGTSQAAPHVSGIAALVAQDFPELNQHGMERILKNAARGNPLPADGTWFFFPFDPVDPMYFYDWKGNEYGAGFLQADQAVVTAWIKNMGL